MVAQTEMRHEQLLELAATLNSLELLPHQSLQTTALTKHILTYFITIRSLHTSTRSCAD